MLKNRINGVCSLCLKQKRLVDSHIIPKFHYTPLKAKEGLFYTLSSDPEISEKKEQKGATEYLLCAECDNVTLQKNEEHLARVLFGGTKIRVLNKGYYIHLSGFDYKRIKIALLSILWRMSLSKDKRFKSVKLGELDNERIRKIIIDNLDLAEEEYPISFTIPLLDGKFYPDCHFFPDSIREGANRLYRCVISGFIFSFWIGAQVDSEAQSLFIQADGSWIVPKMEVCKIPFLNEAFNKLGNSMRKRNRGPITPER